MEIAMKFVLDRIEGNFAVCFDYDTGKDKYEFMLSDLGGISEGDIFTAAISEENRAFNVEILKEETLQKKASLQKRLDALFNNSK
jgi:hypothetical protein